jgi:hypothetical protein
MWLSLQCSTDCLIPVLYFRSRAANLVTIFHIIMHFNRTNIKRKKKYKHLFKYLKMFVSIDYWKCYKIPDVSNESCQHYVKYVIVNIPSQQVQKRNIFMTKVFLCFTQIYPNIYFSAICK